MATASSPHLSHSPFSLQLCTWVVACIAGCISIESGSRPVEQGPGYVSEPTDWRSRCCVPSVSQLNSIGSRTCLPSYRTQLTIELERFLRAVFEYISWGNPLKLTIGSRRMHLSFELKGGLVLLRRHSTYVTCVNCLHSVIHLFISPSHPVSYPDRLAVMYTIWISALTASRLVVYN